MKLSIVSTLYQSAPYIAEFHQRASSVANKLVGDDYEIVLVNDGSPDNSLDLAIALTEEDYHVVVVDLSRNFGHHPAMMAGLAQAKGGRVFLIDSDLEEDPCWLSMFSEIMTKSSCDVVFGVQKSRKGSWFEKWSGHVFYRIFNYLCDIEIAPNQTVARLMSSQYVRALLQYGERELFFGGVLTLAGFNQVPYEVVKSSTSPTTYTLNKRVAQTVNALCSFSSKPLFLISQIGFAISGLGFLFIVFLGYSWMTGDNVPLGWTSVAASIWLSTGFLMISIGIVGIYVTKVFAESKERPRVIVRSVFSRKRSGANEVS
jgi:putative glycosyltransferase